MLDLTTDLPTGMSRPEPRPPVRLGDSATAAIDPGCGDLLVAEGVQPARDDLNRTAILAWIKHHAVVTRLAVVGRGRESGQRRIARTVLAWPEVLGSRQAARADRPR